MELEKLLNNIRFILIGCLNDDYHGFYELIWAVKTEINKLSHSIDNQELILLIQQILLEFNKEKLIIIDSAEWLNELIKEVNVNSYSKVILDSNNWKDLTESNTRYYRVSTFDMDKTILKEKELFQKIKL